MCWCAVKKLLTHSRWRICAATPTCSLVIVLALSDALGPIQIMLGNLLQNGVANCDSAQLLLAIQFTIISHIMNQVQHCQWVLPLPYYAVFFCWEIAYHYDQLLSFLQIHSLVCSRWPAACLMNLLLYFSQIRSPAMMNSLFWIIADRTGAAMSSGDCTVRRHRHAFCSTKEPESYRHSQQARNNLQELHLPRDGHTGQCCAAHI